MDLNSVFQTPPSVIAWLHSLGFGHDIELHKRFSSLGYDNLIAVSNLDESDLDALKITLPGHRKTFLAASAILKKSIHTTYAQNHHSDVHANHPPIAGSAEIAANSTTTSTSTFSTSAHSSSSTPKKRTPIVNSAIPPRLASDYWDRATNKQRFESRVHNGDGIHLLLVRHAQSLANVDLKYYTSHSDYSIPLSEEGTKQASETGVHIAKYYRKKLGLEPHAKPPPGWQCRIWTSPYLRTRQTSKFIMDNADGWVTDIQENVLLVEQNFGLFEGIDWYSGELDDKFPDELHHYQKAVAFGGKFWAKVPLGESRFDVCMRVAQAFPTIHRDVARCNLRHFIIVGHGITLRAFVMMWMRYLPEWFEEEPNPSNCSIRVIDDYEDLGYIWPKKTGTTEKPYEDILLKPCDGKTPPENCKPNQSS